MVGIDFRRLCSSGGMGVVRCLSRAEIQREKWASKPGKEVRARRDAKWPSLGGRNGGCGRYGTLQKLNRRYRKPYCTQQGGTQAREGPNSVHVRETCSTLVPEKHTPQAPGAMKGGWGVAGRSLTRRTWSGVTGRLAWEGEEWGNQLSVPHPPFHGRKIRGGEEPLTPSIPRVWAPSHRSLVTRSTLFRRILSAYAICCVACDERGDRRSVGGQYGRRGFEQS